MEQANTYWSVVTYWEHLTKEEKEYAERNSVIRKYKKGSLIHSGSDDCLGMVTLISGEMRAYLLSEEGREITLFRVYDGEACVLTASCIMSQITFETHMVAAEDCELLILNAGALEKLTERNIYARCYMYEMAVERFSAVMWSMQQILFAGFDKRLASFLLGEYERTEKVEINMTHEQIAQHVSSAREVVARMLKRFVGEGLVEIKRGFIILKDIKGLEELL